MPGGERLRSRIQDATKSLAWPARRRPYQIIESEHQVSERQDYQAIFSSAEGTKIISGRCLRCIHLDIDKATGRVTDQKKRKQRPVSRGPLIWVQPWMVDTCAFCAFFAHCMDESTTSGYGDRYYYNFETISKRFVRSVLPDNPSLFLDLDMVRAWVNGGQSCSTCRDLDMTRLACMPSELAAIVGLKYIDCFSLTIENRPATPHSYVALSYVWGKQSRQEGEPRLGPGQSLPEYLPATIVDAVWLTCQLGLRYLWIDRYCIDQTNSDEVHSQVSQMDIIFQHASLTIIAAEGSATNGLSGCPRTPRKELSSRLKTGRDEFFPSKSMTTPTRDFKDSLWGRRGWTLQEGLLSRKRLIFTAQGMGLQCQHGQIEAEHWGVAQDSSGLQPFLAKFDMENGETEFASVESILADYASRRLTFESDRLRAVSGILHAFHSSRLRLHNVLGVPLIEASLADFHNPNSANDSNHALAFLRGVCFERGRGLRRDEFPSWSWTGWKFGVEGLPGLGWPRCIHKYIAAHDQIKVELGCQDGSWMAFENFLTKYEDIMQPQVLSSRIRISARVLDFAAHAYKEVDTRYYPTQIHWRTPAGRHGMANLTGLSTDSFASTWASVVEPIALILYLLDQYGRTPKCIYLLIFHRVGEDFEVLTVAIIDNEREGREVQISDFPTVQRTFIVG